ncbi:hypothetical protein R69927_02276 [Paraburkholderia domus]|uniref:hypothetical protein n=1 Tax=Paraburkholderia domus TaxID=2793075 RepID=UPI0019143FED|nr:hypothetical protein [Paraburkholderia domus]MBK5061892.1 hypothetical protein [Burkholderia sp. R-70199]MBK5087145.1 hypothetical protein [Burkholderia sp. R-69927]MBK5180919.1 hypothetical protein [Burkholderia sp. R-69749]CAE6734279.1 hypothetical protein R75483_02356 [Paraburkholderia domus]CAE6808149.1 hypothetical protein R69749_02949 [Paraburkholderia domus]
MNVTSEHLKSINAILKSKKRDSDPAHFLALLTGQFIIYGMDDPQRNYLAIALLAEEAFKANQTSIDEKKVGPKVASDKAVSKQVSNYFIDFNKQGDVVAHGAGFALIRGADPTPQDATREAERAAFSTRFETSSLGLTAVPNADQLFSGAKKDNLDLYKSKKELKDLTGSLKNFAVRRACKFLIYDSIKDGVKIAYALDDLTLLTVVTGAAINLRDPGGKSVKQKVPVCTSEIREIFRNWDYLKDHVVFFKDFKSVPPPWCAPTAQGNEIALWAKYAAARARKLQAKYDKTDNKLYKTVKNTVASAAQNNIPILTLRDFHASKPSAFNPRYALPVDNEAHENV